MTNIEVTAWVPIRKMLRFEESMPNDFYECISDMLSGLPFALMQLSQSLVSIEAKLATPSKKVTKDLFSLNQNALARQDFYEYLKIDACFSYDKEALEAQNPNSSFSHEMITGIAPCELSSILEDALVLTQLAYPARIKSEIGRSWVGNRPFNTISDVTGFGYNLIIPQEPFWPSISTISLKSVCEWESQLGLFQQGVAKTPIQRTLASFTHATTLPTSRSGELLFWAMQGLEAFYCRGMGDLRRQLSEKSKIFLGSWEDKKNIVGHLYDFRSKFVHGSFNLDRWNNNQDHEEDAQGEAHLFYDSMTLALKIMIATLQKCVNDKITSLEFNYKVEINS